jgi:hypothetical protein
MQFLTCACHGLCSFRIYQPPLQGTRPWVYGYRITFLDYSAHRWWCQAPNRAPGPKDEQWLESILAFPLPKLYGLLHSTTKTHDLASVLPSQSSVQITIAACVDVCSYVTPSATAKRNHKIRASCYARTSIEDELASQVGQITAEQHHLQLARDPMGRNSHKHRDISRRTGARIALTGGICTLVKSAGEGRTLEASSMAEESSERRSKQRSASGGFCFADATTDSSCATNAPKRESGMGSPARPFAMVRGGGNRQGAGSSWRAFWGSSSWSEIYTTTRAPGQMLGGPDAGPGLGLGPRGRQIIKVRCSK